MTPQAIKDQKYLLVLLIFNNKYMILNIFKLRRKRKKQKRLHFIIDISLSILILILIVVLLTFNLYRPTIIEPIIPEPDKPIDEPPVKIINPLEISFSINSNITRHNSGVLLDIDYYNNGEEIIDEIRISFESLSSAFSVSNVQSIMLDKNSQIKSSALIIQDVDSLSGGNISLKVYFSGPSDPLIRNTAWQALVELDYLEENFILEHPLINICFLSDTNVSAKAFYHSLRGDQLGIGPIPPIASIPTSYWVFFEVENLGNNLEDFLISAILPDHASLSDKKTLLAGTYSFNEENNRLIWQVNQVSRSGGVYRAGFEIKVLPTENNIGKSLNILENISYRYKDSTCFFETSNVLPSLDTNLKHDFINQGSGVVIE